MERRRRRRRIFKVMRILHTIGCFFTINRLDVSKIDLCVSFHNSFHFSTKKEREGKQGFPLLFNLSDYGELELVNAAARVYFVNFTPRFDDLSLVKLERFIVLLFV